MFFSFLEIMAGWSLPYLIMFVIAFTAVRFGLSKKFNLGKSVILFVAGLFLTASSDFIFAMITGGAILVDAEPVAGLIPNVFSIPFMASVVVLFAGVKLWKSRQEDP